MSDLGLKIDELLTTTRAVRKRLDLDRPVPLELVEECLEIALQAPSAANRQAWHWIVVTDPDLRTSIGEVYRRSVAGYLQSEAAAGDRFEHDPARAQIQQRIAESVTYLGEHMAQVPVHVLGCLWVSSGQLPAGNQAGLWGSVLPAAWSYMLAARSRGLGTAWTTLHLAHEREIAALLGLPMQVRQGVLIPTAYTRGTTFRPAAREPLADALHLNGW